MANRWNIWLAHAQKNHRDYLKWNEDWSKRSWRYAIPFILAIPIIFFGRNLLLIYLLSICLVFALIPIILIPRRATGRFRRAWQQRVDNVPA